MKFSQIKEENRMDSFIFQDKVSAKVDTKVFQLWMVEKMLRKLEESPTCLIK